MGAAVDPAPSWAKASEPYVAAPVGTPTDATTVAGVYTGEGKYASGVHRRDFRDGVALVNPGSVAATVALGPTYHRLTGTRAPTVDSGAEVTTVTIPAQDGLIPLNGPASPRPLDVGGSRVGPFGEALGGWDAS